jgi:hypothetical protein
MFRCIAAVYASLRCIVFWSATFTSSLSTFAFIVGTVALAPTVITCVRGATSQPAFLSAATRGPYLSRFLETVSEKHMSDVNPDSATISFTANFSPLFDVQVFVGPLGGCSVSGQPSNMTISGLFLL